MTPPPPSRRALLKRGLAVAAAGGLAGCGAGTLPLGGDEYPPGKLPAVDQIARAHQYDRGHTGVPETGAAGLPDGAEVYWRYRTGKSIEIDAMPAVLAGQVFVPVDRGLSAFDPRNDERLWRREIGATVNSPAIAAGRVLVGASDDTATTGNTGLYAFGADSGEQLWHVMPRHQVTAPVERGGVVYAGSTPAPADPGIDSGDGTADGSAVRAFDLGTGTDRWEYPMAADPGVPALGEGAVYVTAEQSGEVHAVDAETGEGLWVEEVGAYGVPTVRGHNVCVLTDRGLAALDAADGEPHWHRPFDVGHSVALTGDAVYATRVDPDGLVAIEPGDGSIRWGTDHDGVEGSPVVVGDHIYTGGPAGIQCFDASDGTAVWTVETDGRSESDLLYKGIAATPLVFDGVAFAATDAGDVYALGPPEVPTERTRL